MTRNAYQARTKGKVSYATLAGVANYQQAAQLFMTFPDVRTIESLAAVKIVALCPAASGYICEPISISGNIVRFRVRQPSGTFGGSALAAHTHALHLNDADVLDGAGSRVNAGANLLGANTGADIAVAGVLNTAGAGGVVALTAGTPAGAVTVVNPEVTNATDLSAGGANLTYYGEAFGYV